MSSVKTRTDLLSWEEQHISRFYVGAPTGILAKGGDRGQRRNSLAVLNNESIVAKALTDRGRMSAGVLVGPGQ